jgi:general secretion pathway protein K
MSLRTGQFAGRAGDSQRGAALIMVLALGAVIVLIALAANAVVMEGARATRVGLDEIRLDDLAQSGLDLAAAVLSSDPAAGHSPTTTDYVLQTGTIRLTMRNEAGRFDLNLATPSLLRWLLVRSGAEPERAARLAAAVVAWRQPTRPNGAPVANNIQDASQPSIAAAGRPFADVAELAPILGPQDALFVRVAPMLTTFSAIEQVNPIVADPAVMQRLLAPPDGLRDVFAQTATTADALKGLPADVRIFFGTIFSEAVRVRVEAQAGTLRRTYEGVVRLSRRGGPRGEEFTVLSWHRVVA